MKLFSITALIALLALMAPTASAAVVVKTVEKGYAGDSVIKMTPTEVTVKKGAIRFKIAVNIITDIRFSGENSRMLKVREFTASGRYENAVELLEKIKPNGFSAYVSQDVEFYRAYCRGQMALGGTIKPAEAVKELESFVTSHPNNYHVLKCSELLGRLEVALGNYDRAEKHYLVLVITDWPDYKIQAYTAVGESAVTQGNFGKARLMFDRALKVEADDDMSKQNQNVARIGVGRCLAESGDVAGGIATINKVIKDVGPESRRLLPRAYVALGYCYKKDDKPQEAVLQFLMVDLVYNAHRASHAEALKNLVGLWQSINKIENSRKAKARLKQLYPGVG